MRPLLMILALAVMASLSDLAHGESVLVLGAGAAGIAAARRLLEAGITNVLVLEGGSSIGGRMKSADFAGRRAELGANWILGNATNWLVRLAKEQGVQCSLSDWESMRDYDDRGPIPGRLRWDDIAAMDVRFGGLAREYSLDAQGDLSLSAALRLSGWHPRDKYDEALTWYYYQWVDAVDPVAVSVKAYPATSSRDFGPDFCLVNDSRGFSKVLRDMADASGLSGKIRLNQTVRSISYSESGVEVTTQDTKYLADHAIVTFSVGVLQHGLVNFLPALPAWKTEAIQKHGMATYTTVFFEFPRKFWPDEEFFFYVDSIRGYYALWLNRNLEHQYGRGPPYVLSVAMTDVNANMIEFQSKNTTMAQAVRVLQSMFPEESVPRPTRMLFHGWSADPLFKGSYSFWPVGVSRGELDRLCAAVGPVWFAGEACSDYYGFVHGALMSGRDTADALIGKICDGSVPGREGPCP